MLPTGGHIQLLGLRHIHYQKVSKRGIYVIVHLLGLRNLTLDFEKKNSELTLERAAGAEFCEFAPAAGIFLLSNQVRKLKKNNELMLHAKIPDSLTAKLTV